MYALEIPANLLDICRLTLTETKRLLILNGERLETIITTKGFRQDNLLLNYSKAKYIFPARKNR